MSPVPFSGSGDEAADLLPAGLCERGFALSPAGEADLPFLRQLYRQLRSDELAPLGWPAAVQAAFADSQFALQHAHYLAHYGRADFLLLRQHGEPVGRYYLLREPAEYLIVDISLCARLRGQGVGSALLAQTQHEAGRRGCGLRLHVRCGNDGAERLYRRLGFAVVDDDGVYRAMRWRCGGREDEARRLS